MNKIKIIDLWKRILNFKNKKNAKCNHIVGIDDDYETGIKVIFSACSDFAKDNMEMEFDYCPLCGEKINDNK